MPKSQEKNIVDILKLLKNKKFNFCNFDENNLYIRLIQTYNKKDPYLEYLDGENGKPNDEAIYEWSVWKRRNRIVKDGQLIIPLLKVTGPEGKDNETWLFTNVLYLKSNLEEPANNIKDGYPSCDYDVLIKEDSEDGKKYCGKKFRFKRTSKEHWPLIKYCDIYKRIIEKMYIK